MSSSAISNYKYIVYLLIRSTVSDYRTSPTLRAANIKMPKQAQKQLRRYMKNFMQETAEVSYSKFLQDLKDSQFEKCIQQNEENLYLGGMGSSILEFLDESISRKDRQIVGIDEILLQQDQEITALQQEIQKLEQ